MRDISSILLHFTTTSLRQESQLPTACLELQAGGYEDGCHSPYVSKTPQAVRLSLRPCTPFIGLRAQKLRFFIRMITKLPSKIRQMEEFIRPLVEERLIKMEEFGETWDDAPVRRHVFLLWYCFYLPYESTE